MNLRDQSVAIACAAIAEPTSTLTGGENQQGLPLTRIAFPDADVVYSARALMPVIGDKVEIVIPEGTSAVTPEGLRLRITGLKDGDDVALADRTLLPAGTVSGKPAWTDNGLLTGMNDLLEWDEGENNYALEVNLLGIKSQWNADSSDDPWDATFDPAINATDIPTVTQLGIIAVFDADGNDCYGDTLPTMTKINAVLIECLAGEADIEVNGDELKSVSAGEKRLASNVNGLASYLDTMEITATAADTEIRITVIGES